MEDEYLIELEIICLELMNAAENYSKNDLKKIKTIINEAYERAND